MLKSYRDVLVNIESISFINVKRLRGGYKGCNDIYIKRCEIESLPEAEANTIYHITNSVYSYKINYEWYTFAITNFVGTREQFIQAYGESSY